MKISVVIPAYLPSEEYFNYLTQAVNSIKSQTYKNIDIVIVFNGCIPIKYDDVKSIVIKNKCSAAVSRNIGASHSIDSDYICFLDCDDVYESEKIKMQLEVCITNNIDFCFTEAITIDKKNNILGNYVYSRNGFSSEEIKNILPEENILITSSSMIKTKSFFECGMFCPSIEYNITNNGKHHNEKNSVFEDYFLWNNAINKQYTFYKLPKQLIRYRVNTSVER